jgi:hypothetical protein
MRKVIVCNMISLDGYYAGRAGVQVKYQAHARKKGKR